MFWEQTSPHFTSTSTTRVHTQDLCVMCENRAIVATLTIVPHGPMLYSGSLWIALQPLISLFTSWTAHSQTQRQRRWLRGECVRAGGSSTHRVCWRGSDCDEKIKKGCLIVRTKMLWPRPSVCILGNRKNPVSLCDVRVILVTSYAVSRVDPTLSFPIVMLINLLALSPEQSEVAFEELGSHNNATSPGPAQGSRQQAFLWAIFISSHRRWISPLEEFGCIPLNFRKFQVALFPRWLRENKLCVCT